MSQSRKLATSVGLSALALLTIGLVIALSRRPKVLGYVDPPTLIFAYTPVEDPAVYAKVWDGFLQHLKSVTGKRVQFFPIQSNAAQLEAMRAGRLHVAGFNTGSTPLAVACAGFEPFAMMASKKIEYGYEMELITYPGSGIDRVEDIKGKSLAFTTQTSNSGFKAPSALLAQRFNMIAVRDYEPLFSGKHDNSILGVANKDYLVAAIANPVKWSTQRIWSSSTNQRSFLLQAMESLKIWSLSWRPRLKPHSFPSIGKVALC